MDLALHFDKNYLIYLLNGEVWVDGKLYDSFKVRDWEKRLRLPENANEVQLKIAKYTSMPISLQELKEEEVTKAKVYSKITNVFFTFAYIFVLIFALYPSVAFALGYSWNPYLDLAFFIPFLLFAYKQTFHRKGILIVEKEF